MKRTQSLVKTKAKPKMRFSAWVGHFWHSLTSEDRYWAFCYFSPPNTDSLCRAFRRSLGSIGSHCFYFAQMKEVCTFGVGLILLWPLHSILGTHRRRGAQWCDIGASWAFMRVARKQDATFRYTKGCSFEDRRNYLGPLDRTYIIIWTLECHYCRAQIRKCTCLVHSSIGSLELAVMLS